MTQLVTDRLLLRRWRESDREVFARINADPRVMEFHPAPLTREESDAIVDRYDGHFDLHGFGPWAVELRATQEFAGYIGLKYVSFTAAFTPAVEIGWRLAPEYWGRGLATEGAAAAIQDGFATSNLHEIVAFTASANLRSRRVMQKLGMTHNPDDDFDHPQLPSGHTLLRHVLYRLRRPVQP